MAMQRRFGTFIRIALLLVIAVGQSCAIFFLYSRYRGETGFLVTPVAAFSLSLLVLGVPPKLARAGMWRSVVVALTAVSWYIGVFMAVNTFGT